MSHLAFRSFVVFCGSMVFSLSSHAKLIPEVIYGDDSRLDFFEFENLDPIYVKAARATAVMTSKHTLRPSHRAGQTKASVYDLETSNRVCSDEPFADQKTLGWCTGFLVGEDLLLTAGHCVDVRSSCSDLSIVFDYSLKTGREDLSTLDSKTIFSCKEVLHRSIEVERGLDFALIRLDRRVKGREPLKLKRMGRAYRSQEMVVIGHPLGLPTKLSSGASVRENSERDFFVINSDTYGGSSGSPVLGADGLVEGLIVRGEIDFVRDGRCNRSIRCDRDACRGEDVMRAPRIVRLLRGLL